MIFLLHWPILMSAAVLCTGINFGNGDEINATGERHMYCHQLMKLDLCTFNIQKSHRKIHTSCSKACIVRKIPCETYNSKIDKQKLRNVSCTSIYCSQISVTATVLRDCTICGYWSPMKVLYWWIYIGFYKKYRTKEFLSDFRISNFKDSHIL